MLTWSARFSPLLATVGDIKQNVSNEGEQGDEGKERGGRQEAPVHVHKQRYKYTHAEMITFLVLGVMFDIPSDNEPWAASQRTQQCTVSKKQWTMAPNLVYRTSPGFRNRWCHFIFGAFHLAKLSDLTGCNDKWNKPFQWKIFRITSWGTPSLPVGAETSFSFCTICTRFHF